MRLVFILLLLISQNTALGSSVKLHSNTDTNINLIPHIEILTDPSKALTIEQVSSKELSSQWHTSHDALSTDSLNLSFTPHSHWIRFKIKNNTQKNATWLLELNQAGLDYIDYYQLNDPITKSTSKSISKAVFTGDRRIAKHRDLFNRNFVFTLELAANQTTDIYIKIDSYDGLIESTGILLLSERVFGNNKALQEMLFGMFIGLMLAMMIYNLFLFISIGDKSYLIYCLYIFSLLAYSSNYFGYTSVYLFADYPNVNNRLQVISAYLGMTSVVFFTLNYLNINSNYRKLRLVLGILSAIATITLILATVDYFSLVVKINVVNIMLICSICYFASIYRLYQGFKPALYFLIAWTVLFAALMLFSLKYMQLIPAYSIIEMSIQFGASIEVMLLSFGLAHRIKVLKRQKAQAQRAALQAAKDANKLKDDFLANTSHELRTPLNGIIGLAESLMDGAKGKLNQAVNKDLAMVVTSGRRLANLINDILDYSKLKNRNLSINQTAIDLRTVTEVVLTLSKHLTQKTNHNIKLINQIPAQLPPAFADENRLQQILHNLISNAIKFTEQGSITVSAKTQQYQDTKMLHISIKDTGIGICEKDQKSIFDSFEQVDSHIQRKHNGTGIGLSITKHLINLHGGDIWVESCINKGSTFTFSLPTSNSRPANQTNANQPLNKLVSYDVQHDHTDVIPAQTVKPIANNKTPSNNDQKPFRILLVDDEPINRQVLLNHLSVADYQLVEAENGNQALQLINNEQPFDLILLDIMMPNLSGYDVCNQLRQNHSINDLPIIFLTAKNQVSDLVHSYNIGANDFLTKPINKHELVTRVKSHLQLLDMHRNLEGKVAERTEKLVNAQQQLIQSEKMAALGTLTAGVAHEINNPTNFVRVSSQNLEVDLERFQQFLFGLVAEDADKDILESFRRHFEPLYKHIETIKNGTERIKIIVEDLRVFTQLDSAKQKTVAISDLILSTINLVKTQYFELTDFITEFEAKPQIHCNPAQLNQVFMNIIVNACDAIKTQKRQCADPNFKGQIVIGCKHHQDTIEVTFKDNGCGMTKQTQSKLFEPFYTTKEVGEGTGLGLSIAFGIIQKHQGKLTVKSQLNKGTLFTLKLKI